MADLKDFYPSAVQPSPRGDGMPAAPATVARGGGSTAGAAPTSHMKSPAFWTLVIVGVGFLLLHHT